MYKAIKHSAFMLALILAVGGCGKGVESSGDSITPSPKVAGTWVITLATLGPCAGSVFTDILEQPISGTVTQDDTLIDGVVLTGASATTVTLSGSIVDDTATFTLVDTPTPPAQSTFVETLSGSYDKATDTISGIFGGEALSGDLCGETGTFTVTIN